MKLLPIIILLFVSSFSFGQEIAKPDAKLVDAAIESYLKEHKTKFKFAPTEFIIEAEDKSVFQNIKKQVGSTVVVLKTKKELQDYCTQKGGQPISFFVISVSKSGANFLVDIIDDGVKSGKTAGAFVYDSLGVARTCSLTFNASFAFQSIDCLLLPTDK